MVQRDPHILEGFVMFTGKLRKRISSIQENIGL